MYLRLIFSLLSCLLAFACVQPVRGEEPAKGAERTSEESENSEESEKSKERLRFMLDALSQYKVEVKTGDESQPAELLPTPALRWTNTVSGTTDGIVGIWTRGGRPDVVVQFSHKGVWIHEFCSTSLHPLTMSRGGSKLWAPDAAGVTLTPVPKAPTPADTPARRLSQMRQIAERFEVYDDFRPVYSEPKTERTKLRLLPKPLYRYKASGDLVDGALFGMVISTDPEALLMVEAYKTEKGTEWRYALTRMTVYALTAKLDGKEIWSVPERLAGNWAFQDPYYVGLFR